MLAQIIQWLRKMPPAQTQEAHIQWLLNGLCDADIGVREQAQRSLANLCVNRHGDYTPDEVIATLRALQEREGIRNLAWVMRHVEFVSLPNAALRTSSEVREAATQCLHRMRERTEPGYLAQTLLHPSSEPPANPDILLRPAQGVTPVTGDSLLRASEAGEASEASVPKAPEKQG